MGGIWDIMMCNNTSTANTKFQAQLGDSFKGNLTVTPLSAYTDTKHYTVAGSDDEIIGWRFVGKGNDGGDGNKATITVWYVEYNAPYYFDDIYPNRTYEEKSKDLYPIS